MNSPNYLIVRAHQEYNNETKSDKGFGFIVNSTIESVSDINRIVEVVSAPEYTILKSGDEVVIHHNILRMKNSVGGNTIKSNFHIEDDLYYVPLSEVFMYKREGIWIPLDPYCFVKPIPEVTREDLILYTGYKGNVNHVGEMMYPNDGLKKQGVKKGDVVSFSRDSEYEFNIDGDLLYKMSTKDILAIL